MFYRTTMQLAFTSEDEGKDFYYDGQIALPKAHTINPGQLNEERGHIILERCYHDEEPAKPCETISEDWTP